VIADRATVSSKTSTGMFRIVQDDRGRGGSAGPQCASDDCVGNPIQYPEGGIGREPPGRRLGGFTRWLVGT
jgi:hypothetical protein